MCAHTVHCPGSDCGINRLTVALVNKQKISTGKAGRHSQQKFYSAVKREDIRKANGNNSFLCYNEDLYSILEESIFSVILHFLQQSLYTNNS